MSKIQSVRGTKDIYSSVMRSYNHIINEARLVSELFGYEEASFPIFEKAEVFSRPLGVASDVVSKETYTFEDRGGEKITLRPGLCLLYTSPSPRDKRQSRMPSSA